MTREEAKALLGSTALLMFEHDGTSTLDGDKTLEVIDQIFDYFGEQLQDKYDEIELLKHRIEEAMKPKTCDGCKYSCYDDECGKYYYSSYTYQCKDCYRSGCKDNFMENDKQ